MAVFVLVLMGCAPHAVLTQGGQRVEVTHSVPPEGCVSLGSVGGGSTTEMRNQAGAMGANYVHLDGRAKSSGAAYRCPDTPYPSR
jgi:hypothetical protein